MYHTNEQTNHQPLNHLQQKKLKVVRGQADGSFSLMDTSTEQARQIRGMIPYPSGYYEIRAYTRYMLNWGNEPKSWTIQDESSSRYLYGEEVLEQDVVADMNYCMFTRVFPVYMKPTLLGEYKEEMEWYPPHTALASPKVMEEEFDFGELRDYPIALKLDVGASAYWSEIASMQTLDNLLMQGKIGVDDYLERVPDGYISHRQELLEKLRGTMNQMNSALSQSGQPPDGLIESGEPMEIPTGSGNGAIGGRFFGVRAVGITAVGKIFFKSVYVS